MAKTEVSRWSRVVGSQLHTQSIDVDKKDDHAAEGRQIFCGSRCVSYAVSIYTDHTDHGILFT
jgi:hypothetical protein